MKYSVTVNGKNYELPARNEEMDKLIVRMESIADLVRYGEISRKDSLREQYDFVSMSLKVCLILPISMYQTLRLQGWRS